MHILFKLCAIPILNKAIHKCSCIKTHENILIGDVVIRRPTMIKNVAIVSLSSGTIGEDYVKHQL